MSRFGRDDDLKMVTAPNDVWEQYCKKNKEAKVWQKKPFPLFDTMHTICAAVIARGGGSFNGGRKHNLVSQSELDEDRESDNEPESQEESRDDDINVATVQIKVPPKKKAKLWIDTSALSFCALSYRGFSRESYNYLLEHK